MGSPDHRRRHHRRQGILLEAARRGLKALLVEQRDFAWGTSSRSSKLVHGGLRYLEGRAVRPHA
ncbi:FAD-dependent oxidoreductase [Massilia sp. H-1]|nr:FAD-dependent oxidoreductase [Massilia sp. H-1]